jgi:hypothetical protein
MASTVVRLPYPEEKEMAWEGVVEMFELTDHPEGVRRAYGWQRPPQRGQEPEYKVILGKPPVTSAEAAVKVAIAAAYRGL